VEHRLPQQAFIEVLPLERQVQRLGSGEFTTWYPAYAALKARGEDVLDTALRGLTDPNPRVRRWCADLMDHLGDERCVAPLLALAVDPDARVRRQAVHSLACQRCKPEPLEVNLTAFLLETAARDPDAHVRAEAVFGLAFQAPSDDAQGWLEALERDLGSRRPLAKPDRVLLQNARFALRRQRSGAAR
jgi:HEAT repeat protein